MKFTPELPTEPGAALARRKGSLLEPFLIPLRHQRAFGGALCALMPEKIGWENVSVINDWEWCPLVPRDETVPKEEVEKAWWEGWDRAMIDERPCQIEWDTSRAKRVLEGGE